ncbi:hypothetical protein [Sphingobium phenoxybenzoativorans]|uniref:hypothetical protein n=1 Tax=Sphingobium phenoxybenzoativorans TaxID=1592790 RepID=UPI000872754A|nr:hypothetical protein [Sphingobium phenoxybenzoativorans]
MPKLKVFRTPIGFHDAYVAAPSQKAALEAWGADANLFARGIAEVVTDTDLIEVPLQTPGKVIRVLRKADEASEPTPARSKRPKARQSRSPETTAPPRRRAAKATPAPPPPKAEKKPKPNPRPSRDALDKAEEALASEDEAYAEADRVLRNKEQAIKEERRKLRQAHDRVIEKLTSRRDKLKADYLRRIEAWASE